MPAPLSIDPGDEVFVDDGEEVVGHVRRANTRDIVVFVEDEGDFTVPRDFIKSGGNGQIVLCCSKLPLKMRSAIRHLHGETYEEDG
jgi:hypothetical protein